MGQWQEQQWQETKSEGLMRGMLMSSVLFGRADEAEGFAFNWTCISDRWQEFSVWPMATELLEVRQRGLGWASNLCSAPGNVPLEC